MMSKRLVELFPDYCSTGLWLVYTEEELKQGTFGYHASVDADELGISPGLQIAIKYWHWIWEDLIGDSSEDSTFKNKMSKEYVQKWIEDGFTLAAALSTENDNYIFQYKP
jgi:hypothetical protein